MMHRFPTMRALAAAAAGALVLAAMPALAQTTNPSNPTNPTTPSAPAGRATPLPIITPRPVTPTSPTNQTPSALPGAVGTPPPSSAIPGAPSGTAPASGGAAAVNASQIPSLPPADQRSPLPFPAYGTPAPVVQTRAEPGVPQVITLQQAILIAYARSPVLAAARATVGIETAPLSLAESALFPAVTGTVSSTHSRREVTGTSASNGTGSVTTTPGTGTGTEARARRRPRRRRTRPPSRRT